MCGGMVVKLNDFDILDLLLVFAFILLVDLVLSLTVCVNNG